MLSRILTFLAFLLLGAGSFAQQSPADSASAQTEEERLTALVEAQEAEIEEYQRVIARLQGRIQSAEGLRRELLVARLDEANLALLDTTLSLAREVSKAQESGTDVATYVAAVANTLMTLPAEAFAAAEHIIERVNIEIDPETPADAILVDQQLAFDSSEVDEIYSDLIDYLELAPGFGIDITADRERLEALLLDSAENRSVFLEVANREAVKLQVAVATLPADVDLKAWLSAIEAREVVASKAVGSVVALMNRLDIDTSDYRRQLIASTGSITTDVLDVGVLAGLLDEWAAMLVEVISIEGPGFLFSVLLAGLLLVLFMQLGKIVQQVVARALSANRVHLSSLLKKMILSTVRNVILIIGVLVALSQVGISLGPLLAGLGVAGFIIGFALQDSLSNFVSGLMILVYRPFDVGDFVEVAGVRGQVNAMSLVNTSFLSIDNQKLVVPNNMVWQSVITNYTDQSTRRVDLTFGISYSDDIDKAETVIQEVLDGYDTILEDPAPVIKVASLGDSSVNLIVRPWVQTEDYWNTYWDLTKLVKQAFDREGITIPFPQRDVHHFGQPSPSTSD